MNKGRRKLANKEEKENRKEGERKGQSDLKHEIVRLKLCHLCIPSVIGIYCDVYHICGTTQAFYLKMKHEKKTTLPLEVVTERRDFKMSVPKLKNYQET